MDEYNNYDDGNFSYVKPNERDTTGHKRREERKRRKELKFSNRKHPKTAIVSSILAAVTLICLISAVVLAVYASGNAGILAGILTAAGFIIALLGFILGVVSFSKTDAFYGYAWLGVISNGVLWLAIGAVFVMGF